MRECVPQCMPSIHRRSIGFSLFDSKYRTKSFGFDEKVTFGRSLERSERRINCLRGDDAEKEEKKKRGIVQIERKMLPDARARKVFMR
jgi:hypothetical protein